MVENEKPLSDYISSVEQVEVPVEGEEGVEQEIVKPKKSKVFPILVGILLLLIIGMGGYYVYKEYFAKEKVDTSQVIEEEEEESSDNTMEQNNAESVNLPEYEFSAQMPSFTMDSEDYVPGEVEESFALYSWSWLAEVRGDIEIEKEWYPNYLKTVGMTFYPGNEAFGCGLGCGQEHIIKVDIYENKEVKSLQEVKEIYFENVALEQDDELGIEIVGSNITKWNQDVIKFSRASYGPDTLDEGYLVVTPKFVYIITYFLSEEPANSFAEANNLIDSFKFGE